MDGSMDRQMDHELTKYKYNSGNTSLDIFFVFYIFHNPNQEKSKPKFQDFPCIIKQPSLCDIL